VPWKCKPFSLLDNTIFKKLNFHYADLGGTTPQAFVPLHRSSVATRYVSSLGAKKPSENDGINIPPPSPFVVDRRCAITTAGLSISALGLSAVFPSRSYADDIPVATIGTDPAHPIVIIGAGGKVCPIFSNT
jgi:hypothetical protein